MTLFLNGLIGEILFYCINLPDRFIPWANWECAIYSWLDGWTGRIYQNGVYLCSQDAIDEANKVRNEVLGLDESIEGVHPIDAPFDDPSFLLPSSCYGLRYEASSLEEWLTMWLDEGLEQYF